MVFKSDSSHIGSLYGSFSPVLFLILLINFVFMWIIWLAAAENLFVGYSSKPCLHVPSFKNNFHCSSQDAAAVAKSLQSCPTLCDPIDGSPPGSPVPGILQARTLEWVAISFFSASKWKVKVKLLSRVWLLATPWTAAHQAPPSMDFPGKSTGVVCHCLLC